MSYIDCFRHELLGYFNGLPIYHPLEEIVGDGPREYDFSGTPDNLILGGGAGEHPALVLHNLPALAASYLCLAIKENKLHHSEITIPISEKTIDAMYDLRLTKSELEFCYWHMSDIHEFVELAKSPLHRTPLKEGQRVEDWIEDSIGEFIYYSLPELIPDEFNRLFNKFRKWGAGYWMNNVRCPPPNYIKTRQESMSYSSFQEAGFFRWNYLKSE